MYPFLSQAISPQLGSVHELLVPARSAFSVPGGRMLPRASRMGHRLQPVSAGLHFNPSRRARPSRLPGGFHRVLSQLVSIPIDAGFRMYSSHRCLSAKPVSGRPAASGAPRRADLHGGAFSAPEPALSARADASIRERSHMHATRR